MISLPFYRKPKRKDSSSDNKDLLGFDLFYQLAYMSAISTAGIQRSQIFQRAAELRCVSASYFQQVHLLAKNLNYDYSEACRLVGESAKEEEVRSLLLRLSGSLSSGESEDDFLAREAKVQVGVYTNKYERDLQSLKSWTDAYIALIIGVTLIVMVATISSMIYPVGTTFIIGVTALMLGISGLGAWLIYRISPHEVKLHSMPQTTREHSLARRLAWILTPLTVVICGGLALQGMDMGKVLVVAGVLLFPIGVISLSNDRKINKKDAEIGTFLRALGGIGSAIGATMTEALRRLDMRSIPALMPHLKTLATRLSLGLNPALCWRRLAAETGSEVIKRSIDMFWEATSMGGEAEKVGSRASLFATTVGYLRARRGLISSTFRWLSLAIHVAAVSLLLFIVEIVSSFARLIQGLTMEQADAPSYDAYGTVFNFDLASIQSLHPMVAIVVVVLSVVNAVAPHVTAGGHALNFFYYLGITLFLSGVAFLAVPPVVELIFGTISAIGG